MKHIVARAFSTVRTNFKFGAPGLGDRIHHILFAYNYSVMENTPVTLHLTNINGIGTNLKVGPKFYLCFQITELRSFRI